MRYRDDKGGSKLLFVFIGVVLVYCSFFNFNIPAAYTYAAASVQNFVQQL